MTQNSKGVDKFAVLASDIVTLAIKNDQLVVKLINVNRPPYFNNVPGLPGGLIQSNETAEQAAKRLLTEKASINTSSIHLEQLYTFSEINRDPRNRVVAVAYICLLNWESLTEEEVINNNDSWWEPISKVENLAYDHNSILKYAVDRLRSRVRYTTLINRLMPEKFTLTQLEKAYETILGTELDRRNFRKKFLKLGLLEALSEKQSGAFRPAQLYRFKSNKVENIETI